MSETTRLRGPVAKERPALTARQVERRSLDGTVLSVVDLAPEVFGREPNVALLHQVVTAQLAARRAGTQSTRTRAEVRGGGKKPFRQKGTGNARQGTIRAPQYPGGGIALGPKPRSYDQRTPKKMIRAALYGALSDRAAEGRVALIDSYDAWSEPRTKEALAALAALGLAGRVLVVLSPADRIARYAFRNLGGATTIAAGELSAYDVLAADWILFSDATLPAGEGSTHA